MRRGEKVGILLMNCLEWLPIYFGILKAGGLAVPLNYRYTAEEIKYCLDLADVSVLVFGKEFIGRVEAVFGELKKIEGMLFVGEECPTFAESYDDSSAVFPPKTRRHVERRRFGGDIFFQRHDGFS